MNIFKKIGMIFMSIWTVFFNATEAAWNKLDQPVKDAFYGGTGFTELLKDLAVKGVEEFYKLANDRLKMTNQQVDALLDKLGNFFNLKADNKDELLLLIKQELAKGDKKEFSSTANTIMQFVAQFLAPDATPFKIISFFAEWFYQKKFKKAID